MNSLYLLSLLSISVKKTNDWNDFKTLIWHHGETVHQKKQQQTKHLLFNYKLTQTIITHGQTDNTKNIKHVHTPTSQHRYSTDQIRNASVGRVKWKKLDNLQKSSTNYHEYEYMMYHSQPAHYHSEGVSDCPVALIGLRLHPLTVDLY